MFICKECHEKNDCGFFHMPVSYGRCEVCGKTSNCYDCLSHHKKTRPDPALLKALKDIENLK